MKKLTSKQNKFAQLWHETGNKSEAYRAAYSAAGMSKKNIHEKASILSRHEGVAARYQQLSKASQERSRTTVDELDAMLKEAYRVAKDTGKAPAMVSAVSALSNLHGLSAELREKLADNTEEEDLTPIEIHIVDKRVRESVRHKPEARSVPN